MVVESCNSLTRIQGSKSLHYFTGQRWATFKGLRLFLFKFLDLIIIKLADKIYADSFSQSNFLSKTLKVKKPSVIHYGSLSGVDFNLFNPNLTMLSDLKIDQIEKKRFEVFTDFVNFKKRSKNNTLFGYVGRINKDKGVDLMIKTFKKHLEKFPLDRLVMIGPIEISKNYFSELIANNNSILHLDFTFHPNYYYPYFNILLLPSLREGFGSVLIEAGACGVPAISTKIPGPIDFITHMKNGILIKKNSRSELESALELASKDKNLIKKLGLNAYKKVKEKYSREIISKKFFEKFNII